MLISLLSGSRKNVSADHSILTLSSLSFRKLKNICEKHRVTELVPGLVLSNFLYFYTKKDGTINIKVLWKEHFLHWRVRKHELDIWWPAQLNTKQCTIEIRKWSIEYLIILHTTPSALYKRCGFMLDSTKKRNASSFYCSLIYLNKFFLVIKL